MNFWLMIRQLQVISLIICGGVYALKDKYFEGIVLVSLACLLICLIEEVKREKGR